MIGPTQRYGYVAGGQGASPADEFKYIDEVRKQYYSPLGGMPVPVSEENFKVWGCSSSPTLVLVDRKGIVRMFRPGKMTYEELAPQVEKLVSGSRESSRQSRLPAGVVRTLPDLCLLLFAFRDIAVQFPPGSGDSIRSPGERRPGKRSAIDH